MSSAPAFRPRRQPLPAQASAFSDGQPAWHFALDAGALVVLLGLGVLGFSLSFGGDPYYLIAGFGGILLGLGIAAANAHFRLGALITTAATLGAYLVLGTLLAVPDAAIAGFVPTLESLRTLLLGVVFSWKDMLTVGVPVGTAGGMLIVPFLSALITAVAAGLMTWRLKSPYWPLLPVLVLFVTGIAFSTNAGFLNVERGISLDGGGGGLGHVPAGRAPSPGHPQGVRQPAGVGRGHRTPRQGAPAGIRRRCHRGLRCHYRGGLAAGDRQR